MNQIALRIICFILLIIGVFIFTGCGIIIINDIDKSSAPRDTGTDTQETKPPEDSGFSDGSSPGVQSNGNLKDGEGTVTNEELARSYLDSVYTNSRKTLNNIYFVITTTDSETISPKVSGDTKASSVSRARIERNRQIREIFKVNIVTKVSGINDIFRDLKNNVLADTYYTDILAVPQENLGAFYADGLLMNLKNLPYIELDSPYFNQSSIDASSGGFGVYGLSGDGVFNQNLMTGIYINKDLIRAAGLDLPYGLVYDGTWTWDKLYEISSSVSGSLNDEIYPVTSMIADDVMRDLIFTSSGNKYMKSGVMSVPSVGFTPASAAGVVDLIRLYLNDGKKFGGGLGAGDSNADVLAAFTEGNSLYMIGKLYVMSWMANMKTDWGVVPLPKFSEEQESYQTLTDSSSLMLAVPVNNNNVDAASVVIQGINAGSYGWITEKYITYHMNYILRDNDSINMIDIIMKSQVFDFAFGLGSAYSSVRNGTVSVIERAAGAGGSDIERLLPNYSESIIKTMTAAFPLSN